MPLRKNPAAAPAAPKEQPKIPACVYSGDAGDEYCKNCNGTTMMVDGVNVSCKTCGGYMEPDAAPSDEDAPPVTETAPVEQELEYAGTNCAVCGLPQFNSPSGVTCPKGHGQAPAAQTPPKQTLKKPAAAPQTPAVTTPAPEPVQEVHQEPDVEEPVVMGVTTLIRAESGVSFEVKDKSGLSRWYKLSFSEERALPPDCDVDAEKQALWDAVNKTIDDQVQDTILYLGAK